MNKGRLSMNKQGDLIFKILHNSDKIMDKWYGPFKITKVINPDTFIIDVKNKLSRLNIKNINQFEGWLDVLPNDISN